jgi:hypothetical protein
MIRNPVSGDPPAIPRFLTRNVVKYSSLIRAVRELPSRTASAVDPLRYRLIAIRAASFVVGTSSIGSQGFAAAQRSKADAVARAHFMSHLRLGLSIMI